jgi:hypothetical protein
MEWQPISTAPKDGEDIIVGFDIADVWIVHVAWWRSEDETLGALPVASDDVGWWSYVRGSVSQEKLDGYREPTHWIELPTLPQG